MLTQRQAAETFARTWNNLDLSLIEAYLDEDTVYESQMVLTPIVGQEEIIKYLRGKFQTFRKSPDYQPMVELAEYREEPCLVLAQGSKENLVGTVIIKVSGDNIRRIDLCVIPIPQEVKRSGVYPR